MPDTEKFVCGDCKGITEFPRKRGSAFIESLLWATLFFPGFFYGMWRRSAVKKICQYCGSTFMLPDDNKINF